MKHLVERDERTDIIEKSGSQVAYVFVSFALLIDVAYRAFKMGQSSLDLLAIVVLSGVISMIYQVRHHALTRSWLKPLLLAFSISLFVVIMTATLR